MKKKINVAILLLLLVCMLYYLLSFGAAAVNMFLFRFCVGFMHLYSLVFFGIKK